MFVDGVADDDGNTIAMIILRLLGSRGADGDSDKNDTSNRGTLKSARYIFSEFANISSDNHVQPCVLITKTALALQQCINRFSQWHEHDQIGICHAKSNRAFTIGRGSHILIEI
jgi:hypothetical protein